MKGDESKAIKATKARHILSSAYWGLMTHN
jgi:hypothetical protein